MKVQTDVELHPLYEEHKNMVELEKANKIFTSLLNNRKAELAVINSENARIEERNNNIKKRIEEIKKEVNTYGELVEKIEKNLIPLESEKQKLILGYKVKNAEKPYADFSVEFFSNRGFKSYLIESVLPTMNEYAGIYSKVLGNKYEIVFSPQKQLKGGELREKFNVDVMNRQGSDNYEGNSNGERRAIDAIVMFVLGDLAASRLNKRVSILILDDVFEKLDEAVCNNIIQVLKMMVIPKGMRSDEFKDLPERESVFVLTHLKYLENQFENRMQIGRGKNGHTEIYRE